jgi:regulator of protease activity HflC (stomatin/prohibitin superfamily)
MDPLVFLFIVVAAALILVAATGFRVVRPFERGLVEFLGRYEKTVDSGLRWVMPFIKRLIKVDMREQVVDVPPQEVITSDNVVV